MSKHFARVEVQRPGNPPTGTPTGAMRLTMCLPGTHFGLYVPEDANVDAVLTAIKQHGD